MLTGEQTPTSAAQKSATAVAIVLGVFPLILMGGAMVLVGLLALGPRKDLATLWICLPAGVGLLGVIAATVYYAALRVPELTVVRFTLNGRDLNFETRRYDDTTCPVEQVNTITDVRNRRRRAGQKLRGWWLQIDRVGWVYLDRQMPNAEQLVNLLRQQPQAT